MFELVKDGLLNSVYLVACRRHLGLFLQHIGDVRLDLLDCLVSMSGPISAPGSNPSATFIVPAVSVRRLVNAS